MDNADGIVWRLQADDGDANGIDIDKLVNMSVCADLDSLQRYVYRSAQARVMAQRKRWFEHIREAYSVLWWAPASHIPTLREASERLDILRQRGSCAGAFTFKQAFAPN